MEQEQTIVKDEQDVKTAENSYGKFSSLDELIKAYNALESEFTRRSQKLKEYEKTYGKQKSIEEQKMELTRKYPIVTEVIEEAVHIAEATETEGKLESALIDVLAKKMLTPEEMASNKQVIDKVLSEEKNREMIINGYIEQIKSINTPATLSSGESPALSPYRATSVKEAGEIAKAIFDRIKK